MTENLTKPALDPAGVEPRIGAGYPDKFKALCAEREKRILGDPLGLTNFGVNLVTLKPGSGSAERHWHSCQDELIYVLEGEITLITNAGEQTLRPGMVAGFPAGVADGHNLINRGATDARYLEIGDRTTGDEVAYPDIDLAARSVDGSFKFFAKDGTPY
ncbi:MAG: cupin domain-containing protein [Alphaproteobacteria bacterium]|nr:cupin domain-containing protein [Alphaproteobacteria bacterium]